MAATKQKHRRTCKGVYVRQKSINDKLAQVEKSAMRSDLPDFGPGDTVKVHVRIKEGEKERIQIFEGIVIARANHGVNRSFTVRKISHGVGVERIFMEASPKVAKLEIAQEGRVRRAKLYYLRNLEGKAARVAREIEPSAAK
jgi:large subunit ribosomal protein L19